jgi:multidrug efflux pump subunit AcrA (membrane-fusion protein)
VPAVQADAAVPYAGVVSSVLVETGEEVEAGQTLLSLDVSDYLAQRQLAQNAFEIASARLAAAEAALDRDRRRAEIALEKLEAQLEYTRAEAGMPPSAEEVLDIHLLELDVELAGIALDALSEGVDPGLEAEAAQAQQRLAELDVLITAAQVVAPLSGTVIRVAVESGDLVSRGETAIVVANMSQIEIESFVIALDLQEMVEGMEATINIASQPGETYPGHIARLPLPYGTGEELEETTIRLAFDDAEAAAAFSVGDRVEIDLVLAHHDDVLWLPPAALREFQGRYFVVVQDGETQRRVDVRTGIEGNSRIEIVEGVSLGERIIGP